MRSASPLEPLFTAVEVMGQRGALQQHQFICDRNSLRRLLKWVRKTEGSKSEDFRIDVDLAGSTCLLTRVEKKATSFITAFQGYGHEYEKASTKWPAGSEGATSHHRIISLKLGGIPIILRCEIDGCVHTSEEDKLSKISKGIGGTNSSSPTSTTVIRGVRVKKSPNPLTPQSSLLEIKTRSAAKPRINWSDVYPQIFFSQTEYLYIARHNDGSFGPVEKHSLTGASLDKHAQSTKASLGKLKDLLESIHNSVLEHGVKTRLTLVCMQGKLGLYHRKGGKIISGDVLSWFAA
ncbi:hypothetical protein DL96DRAFT_1501360 [Flagelloscypha sp. PMI_526]|nr:hypothetical protein DL96DRAFT_1501360 [Flagelloscypha sp. PMI_526]